MLSRRRRLAVAWCRAIIVMLPALCVSTSAGASVLRKGPYLQNVTQTSITLLWQAGRTLECTLRIGNRSWRSKTAAHAMHEELVGGLQPGTRYRYQLQCDDESSQGEFATAPKTGRPFTFVVFGDSRHNPGVHRRVVERVRREVPDFILGTGDMVDQGGREADWQRFFDVERNLLRENVVFPSLGNHDRQGRGRTAGNYRKYFAVPHNSPQPERYYAFTYSNARFLVLDSNSYSFSLTDQTAWLEEHLQQAHLDPKIRHIFVTMHHPPFSVSIHGGRKVLRDAWTPLFARYGVTAVFSGHDHCYERAHRDGVRYFVSGGGGAPLYPRSKKPSSVDSRAIAYFERVNHYIRVSVLSSVIEVTAIRADGSLIESVAWNAEPAGARPSAHIPRPVTRPAIATAAVRSMSSQAESSDGLGGLALIGLAVFLCAGAVLVRAWRARA